MKFYFRVQAFFVVLFILNHQVRAQDSAKLPVPQTINALQHNTNYLKPGAVILPAAFLVYGCLKPGVHSIANLDDNIMAQVKKNHAGFHDHSADYIMWSPTAAIYLMDAFNVNTRHTFKEHLILDAGSIIITGGAGLLMRKISGNIDVYNKQGTKFPSGHTANAFRGAEILHQELKYSHPFLSYSGYVIGVAVGALRIYNKDHLLSEVLAGAGLGMLSSKLTYWIFDKVKYRNRK